MNTTTYRYQLWESVTKHLLPCLNESRQWQALLVEPPFRLPPSCAVQYHSGQPLSALQSSSSQSGVGLTHAWPETKVHSTNTTVLCYVVAGEIDLRIGVTEQIAAQLPKHASHSDYAVISIPKHTFFAIPPGVPYGQGLQGHWERRIRPQLGTSIFWIHFLAPGVLCHQSWYTEEGYVSKGSYYLPDAHLLPAVNALMDEQRRREKSSQHIIHLLLSFIGHSMDRNLQILQPEEIKAFSPHIHYGDMASQIVQQASVYIETHYKDDISVQQIAAHCFVSSSHLSRLFKAGKKITVHQYITQMRLDYACKLLSGTQLRVKEIGTFVGYPNRSHFCQIFTREYHCSPRQYRNKLNN